MTTLQKLRSTLAGVGTPNPLSVLESIFQAIEEDQDLFLVFRAGEALSAGNFLALEKVSLTGSCSIADGTGELVGTSTVFLTELQLGDSVLISGKLFEIDSIDSNTHATARTINSSGGTLTSTPERLQWKKAVTSVTFPPTYPAIARTDSACASGALCRARSYGLVKNQTGLVAGQTYVLSRVTPGTIVKIQDEALIGSYQVVGFALTPEILWMNVSPAFPVLGPGASVTVNRAQDTVSGSSTITVSNVSDSFALSATSGTTDADTTTTFELTGISSPQITSLEIHAKAEKGVSAGARTATIVLKIGAFTKTLVAHGPDTLAGSTTKSFIFSYDPRGNTWRSIELT